MTRDDRVDIVDDTQRRNDHMPLWSLIEALARSADGALIADAAQRIIYWNASAERILGQPYDEVCGRACYDVLAGSDEHNVPVCQRNCGPVATAFRGGTVANYNLCIQVPSSGLRWVNMSTLVFVMDHTSGEPLLVHLFRDATERTRHEQFVTEVLDAAERLHGDDGYHTPQPAPASAALADLTRREYQVLSLLTEGLGTDDIAERLTITPATARNHVRSILAKLNVHTRLEAVVYALKHGLLIEPPSVAATPDPFAQ